MRLLQLIDEVFHWLDNGTPRWLRFLAAIIVFAAIFFTDFGAWLWLFFWGAVIVGHLSMRTLCERTEGLVTGVFDLGTPEYKRHRGRLRYSYMVGAKTIDACSKTGRDGKAIGTAIWVYYRPEAPENGYVHSSSFEFVSALLFLLCVLNILLFWFLGQ